MKIELWPGCQFSRYFASFKWCAFWCAFQVQLLYFHTKDLFHKTVGLTRQKVLDWICFSAETTTTRTKNKLSWAVPSSVKFSLFGLNSSFKCGAIDCINCRMDWKLCQNNSPSLHNPFDDQIRWVFWLLEDDLIFLKQIWDQFVA